MLESCNPIFSFHLQHQEDDGNLLGSWEDIFETSDGQSDVSDPWSTEEGYDADSESDAKKNQEGMMGRLV